MSNDNTITTRIDRLERENWRLKRLGGGVSLGLAALVLIAQTNPPPPAPVAPSVLVAQTVEAQRFIVRDTEGKERAVLAVEPDGRVSLRLQDEVSGPVPRVSVSFRPGAGSAVVLGDATTGNEVRLALQPDGTGTLALQHNAANVTAELSVSPQSSATLALRRTDVALGKQIEFKGGDITLTTGPDGQYISLWSGLDRRATFSLGREPLLAFFDKAGNLGAAVGLSNQGTPILALVDKDGKPRTSVYLEVDGTPKWSVFAKDGKERSFANAQAGGERSWILWLQLVRMDGQPTQRVAVGAWPTRDDCEAERLARAAKTSPTPLASTTVPALACLPDSVNLLERP